MLKRIGATTWVWLDVTPDDRVRELERVNAMLVDALEQVEWACEEWEDGVTYNACPACGEPQEGGHLTDCRIAGAIEAARKAMPAGDVA